MLSLSHTGDHPASLFVLSCAVITIPHFVFSQGCTACNDLCDFTPRGSMSIACHFRSRALPLHHLAPGVREGRSGGRGHAIGCPSSCPLAISEPFLQAHHQLLPQQRNPLRTPPSYRMQYQARLPLVDTVLGEVLLQMQTYRHRFVRFGQASIYLKPNIELIVRHKLQAFKPTSRMPRLIISIWGPS
jgi:hypothetical protein